MRTSGENMRVLLINPAMNLQKLGRFAGLLEPMPCIGLAYIAAALEQHGSEVIVLDMFAEKLSADQIVDKTRDIQPDIVGMTVLTPSEPVCSVLSQRIRAVCPGVKIVGAVHADSQRHRSTKKRTSYPSRWRRNHLIVDAIESGVTDYSGIKGITWLGEGEPVTNSLIHYRDLDLFLPGMAFVSLQKDGLLPFADFAKPVLTMTGSRGCPYRCDYFWSIRVVKSPPWSCQNRRWVWIFGCYKVKQLGLLTQSSIGQKDLKPFCDELVNRGLDKSVNGFWNPLGSIDPETCELMYYGGCRRVLMGIESGVTCFLEMSTRTWQLNRSEKV